MWIEISKSWEISGTDWVTTHTGGVDWNSEFFKNIVNVVYVTTHTGGVDWNNSKSKSLSYKPKVTTHTGGVDWNVCGFLLLCWVTLSPPTRVVWIEIRLCVSYWCYCYRSPPTRVVWIEIRIKRCFRWILSSHHPHGWCGLKFPPQANPPRL